ncbi:MAG: hypothetical protein JO199_10735, partial [Candidatus Eremiobacteraeota bacterium]|nr:hypothetical protein [Candidatus Eremiobacteraeota bacterium]
MPKSGRVARASPRFVSPFTKAIESIVNPGANQIKSITPVDAKHCTGGYGKPYICTVPLAAPAGYDTFDFSTWDAVTPSGTIPKTAKQLGEARLGQAIAPSTKNTLDVYLSGIVASFKPRLTFASLPASGPRATVTIPIDAYDADGALISALDSGDPATSDPYWKPIVATLDTPGATHASLSYDGNSYPSSAQVRFSNANLVVHYDQQASPAYSAVITLKAAGVAQTATVRISPMFVSSTSIQMTPQAPYALTVYGGMKVPFQVTETGAPATTAYSLSAGTCSGKPYESFTSSPSGADTATSLAKPESCKFSVSDGTSVDTVTFANVDGTVGFPMTPIFTAFSVGGQPKHIAAGPDGAVWFADNTAGTVRSIDPNGSVKLRATLPSYGADSIPLVTGSDGYVWFGYTAYASDNNSVVGYIVPANDRIKSLAPIGLPNPDNAIVGPDKNVWLTAYQSVARVTPTGKVTVFPLPDQSDRSSTAIVSDGSSLWIAKSAGTQNMLVRMNVAGTIKNEFVLPNPPAGKSIILGMALGTDGDFYLTLGNGGVQRITPAGGTTNISIPGYAGDITVGPDGGLWAAGSSHLSRIATDGTVNTFGMPPSFGGALFFLTTGPDGSL